MSHDCEAEPEAAVSPRCRAVSLPKTIEHVRQKVGLDPDTRVVHDDLNVRIDTLQRDLDHAALPRKLHAVRQQVPNDLLQTFTIAEHWTNAGLEQHLQSNASRFGGGPNTFRRRLDY